MNQGMDEVVILLNKISSDINERLDTIEKRLARVEKVDAIEHRVTSNHIDITDIKELLSNLEENQCTKIKQLLEEMFKSFEKPLNEELNEMNKRLDSHLIKIAKNEEEIYLIKNPTFRK